MNIQKVEFRKVKKEEFDKLKRLFPKDNQLWIDYGKRRLQQLMNYTINDLETKGYTEFTIGVEDNNEIINAYMLRTL